MDLKKDIMNGLENFIVDLCDNIKINDEIKHKVLEKYLTDTIPKSRKVEDISPIEKESKNEKTIDTSDTNSDSESLPHPLDRYRVEKITHNGEVFYKDIYGIIYKLSEDRTGIMLEKHELYEEK